MITRKCDLERIFLNEYSIYRFFCVLNVLEILTYFTFFAYYYINFDIQFYTNIHKNLFTFKFVHILTLRQKFYYRDYLWISKTKKKGIDYYPGKKDARWILWFSFHLIFLKIFRRDIFLHVNFNRSTRVRAQRATRPTFHRATNRPMVPSFHL